MTTFGVPVRVSCLHSACAGGPVRIPLAWCVFTLWISSNETKVQISMAFRNQIAESLVYALSFVEKRIRSFMFVFTINTSACLSTYGQSHLRQGLSQQAILTFFVYLQTLCPGGLFNFHCSWLLSFAGLNCVLGQQISWLSRQTQQ